MKKRHTWPNTDLEETCSLAVLLGYVVFGQRVSRRVGFFFVRPVCRQIPALYNIHELRSPTSLLQLPLSAAVSFFGRAARWCVTTGQTELRRRMVEPYLS
jgi:hypothetical protein